MTTRVDAEKIVSMAEARVSLEATALNEIPLMVVIVQADLRCEFANKRSLAILGLSAEQVIGKKLSEFMAETEARLLLSLARDCIKSCSEQKASMPIEVGGKKYFFDSSAILIYNASGQAEKVMIVTQDITEQVKRQEMLNDTNRTLNEILDKMPVAFLALNEKFEIDRINEAAVALFGYQPNEVVGRPVNVFLPDVTGDKYLALMHEFAASSEHFFEAPGREEITGRKKDGSAIPFYGSMVKIHSNDRVFYCAMLVDLSKIRQIERELDAVQEQLLQTQKHEALGQLAGNIAHDFNNLLAVIAGYADLMEGDVAGQPECLSMLAEIRRAVQRGSGLTSQILAYAKGPLMDMKIHDLHNVVDGLHVMIQAAAGPTVQVAYSLNAGKKHVQLDETQFTQVILNLIVNARDAIGGTGKIGIATELLQLHEEYFQKIGVDPAPGEYLKLGISDNGSGIPEAVISRIFDPYFSTKGRDKGTGLGLAVVYGIVKKHNGFIFCSSKEKIGTTFSIYLPVVEPPHVQQVAGEGRSTNQLPPLDRANVHILVVDDEDNLRSIIVRQLTTAGFQVYAAANGREGLAFIDNFAGKLDIVLSDISMPEMTGPEMVDEAKLMQPEASYLFMTGNAMALDSDKPGRNIRILKKPFDRDGLMQEIERILDARRQAGQG